MYPWEDFFQARRLRRNFSENIFRMKRIFRTQSLGDNISSWIWPDTAHQRYREDRRYLTKVGSCQKERKTKYADHLFQKPRLRGNWESIFRSEDIDLECVQGKGEWCAQIMEQSVRNDCYAGSWDGGKAEGEQTFMGSILSHSHQGNLSLTIKWG